MSNQNISVNKEPHFLWQGELPVTVSSSGGGAVVGVLTAGPANGYGEATFRSVTINADGTWSATGEEEPVIIPLLK